MNTPLKILIVDDEPYAHKLLESHCKKLAFVNVIGHAYNGLEALNILSKEQVDIVLLDIQMPEISGIELLEAIQKIGVKVVMTTAFSDHAIETYNYDQVVDYVLKPIRFIRFVKALERAKKIIALEEKGTVQQSMLMNSSNLDATFFCIKEGKVVHKITYETLHYVQSYGNYVKLFLSNTNIKIIRNPISKIEKELPPTQFCRIHKSYIINLKYISQVEGNRVQMNEVSLPLGNSYIQYFKERIGI